jgi:hypothetical protein
MFSKESIFFEETELEPEEYTNNFKTVPTSHFPQLKPHPKGPKENPANHNPSDDKILSRAVVHLFSNLRGEDRTADQH